MTKQLIIVPVDGSHLSERVIPYARALAGATDAELLAVGVCHAEAASALVGKRLAEQIARSEEEYFRRYLASLQEQQLVIETELRSGDPVNEVLNVVNERDGQFLALATHGRSGLNRWRYGSVAARLIREASVPTLVVGPKVLEMERDRASIGRILVPLDGSPLSEEALTPASALAEKLDASIVLARGVQWAAQVYPSFDPITLNRALDDSAAAYLEQVHQKIGRTVETKVLRGYPADALIQLVEHEQIDLVVMASHSRAGLGRAVLGSVADRMLQCSAPVLLVRPEGYEHAQQPRDEGATASR